jgi:hypothetical protein
MDAWMADGFANGGMDRDGATDGFHIQIDGWIDNQVDANMDHLHTQDALSLQDLRPPGSLGWTLGPNGQAWL